MCTVAARETGTVKHNISVDDNWYDSIKGRRVFVVVRRLVQITSDVSGKITASFECYDCVVCDVISVIQVAYT